MMGGWWGVRRPTNGATLICLLTVSDPGDDVVRVPHHLPEQELHSQGPHESKYPVIDLLSAPDQMEEMSESQDVDIVAVQPTLLFLRSVVLPVRSNLRQFLSWWWWWSIITERYCHHS